MSNTHLVQVDGPVYKLPIEEVDKEEVDKEEVDNFFKKLVEEIPKIFTKPDKPFDINELDILDDKSEENIKQMKEELKRKQRTMKYGTVWQTTIGIFPGWEDLGRGHASECDLRKIDNTEIIELKNKYNTTNSGGKKDVERKLSQYKKNNSKTECIWGVINEKSGNKKSKENFNIDGVEITKWQGEGFLSHIFTYEGFDYSDKVIESLRDIISKC